MQSFVAFLARQDAPVQVGTIALDASGGLTWRSPDEPLRFGFLYRDIEFHAKLELAPEPRVVLTAALGRLPYSVELGTGRQLMRRVLEATALLSNGRIWLSESQDMQLHGEARPPLPLTPPGIMATLAAVLLALRPYLDLLGQLLDGANKRKPAAPSREPPLQLMAGRTKI